MKLSIQALTPFLCVSSLEWNAGKAYLLLIIHRFRRIFNLVSLRSSETHDLQAPCYFSSYLVHKWGKSGRDHGRVPSGERGNWE